MRLHRGKALIQKHDLDFEPSFQRLPETSCALGSSALAPIHFERKPDHEYVNPLLRCEGCQVVQQFGLGLATEEGSGMRHGPEIVRDGQANSNASQVDACCAHGDDV